MHAFTAVSSRTACFRLSSLARIGLAFILLFTALGAAHTPARAGIQPVVNTLLDMTGPDDTCQPGSTCSLRAAVAMAEPGDKITFAPELSGSLILNSPIIVDESKDLTISGAMGTHQVITIVGKPGEVAFASLGGKLALENLVLMGSNENHLLSVSGDSQALSLNDVTVKYHNGLSALRASGGFVNLNFVVFENNVTSDSGGAVWADNAIVQVNLSTFRGNQASDRGGAIMLPTGTLIVINSTFSGNSASYGNGGAVWVGANTGFLQTAQGQVTAYPPQFLNTTFANNQAGGWGGAVYSMTSDTRLIYSTLTSNHAGESAGGLWGGGILDHTILAGNTAQVWAPDCVSLSGLPMHITSTGYNVIGSSQGCAITASPEAVNDRIDVDAKLGPLGKHLGEVETVIPQVGSPAIDIGPSDLCQFARDARQHERPQEAGCDAGAVEARVGSAPLAKDAAFSLPQDSPLEAALSADDLDLTLGEDLLSYAVLTRPTHGWLNLASDGKFSYRPFHGYTGPDSFTYTVRDLVGHESPYRATVALTVTAAPQPPLANDDGWYQVMAETNLTADPLSFADPRITSFDVAHAVDQSGFGLLADREMPLPALAFGKTYQRIRVYRDGFVELNNGQNDEGVRVDVFHRPLGVDANSHVTIAALNTANVNKITGYMVRYENMLVLDTNGQPSGATFSADLVIGPLGYVGIYYRQVSGDSEPAGLYDVKGGRQIVAPYEVLASGTALNFAPATLSVKSDQDILDGNVLFNDFDPDQSNLTVVKDSDPAYGSLDWQGDGSFSYQSNLSAYPGPGDSFKYTVTNSSGKSASATVYISFAMPIADPENTSVTVEEDSPAGYRLPCAAPISPVITKAPAHGYLEVYPGCYYLYRPDPEYSGPDSFTYHLTDGLAMTQEATLSITVTAVDDPAQPNEDGRYRMSLSSLAESDWIELAGRPGAVELTDGTDIGDGLDVVLPSGSDAPASRTVVGDIPLGFTIPLIGTGQTLEASALSILASGKVLLQDAEGSDLGYVDVLSSPYSVEGGRTHIYYQKLSDPERMVVEFADLRINNSAGVGDYSTFEVSIYPTGRVSVAIKQLAAKYDLLDFTIGISGPHTELIAPHGALSAGLLVDLRPNVYATEPGAPITFTPAELQSNDIDLDGGPAGFALHTFHTPWSNGWFKLTNYGGYFTVTPNLSARGLTSFDYYPGPNDGDQFNSPYGEARVYLNLAGGIHPLDQALMVVKPFGLSLPGQLMVAKRAGGRLTYVLESAPAHGDLTLNADGSFVYTADKAYVGADSFRYVVYDLNGVLAYGTANLTVRDTIPYYIPGLMKSAQGGK